MYKVLKPFNAGDTRFMRERYVDDAVVDSWANKRLLINNKYIVNDSGEHCYVVGKPFFGNGEYRAAGDFIDMRRQPWRNERALLKAGNLRYATAAEVQGFSPPRNSDLAASPGLDNREYLVKRYVADGYSGTKIAKEIGCPAYKVYKALNKFDIPTRAVGMNFKEKEIKNGDN